MAVLGITTLSGCNSIPSFIAAGSKMIFRNATTPVSWTKDTTVNEGMLRVVNGATLNPGGTLTFSQVFTASKSFTVTYGNAGLTPINLDPAVAVPPGTTNTAQASLVPSITIQPATLSTAQIRAHTHQYNTPIPTATPGGTTVALSPGTEPISPDVSNTPTTSSPNSGQGLGHVHTLPPNAGQHVHSVSSPSGPTAPHTHTVSFPQQHTHTSPGGTTGPFSILYTDIIIASKD